MHPSLRLNFSQQSLHLLARLEVAGALGERNAVGPDLTRLGGAAGRAEGLAPEATNRRKARIAAGGLGQALDGLNGLLGVKEGLAEQEPKVAIVRVGLDQGLKFLNAASGLGTFVGAHGSGLREIEAGGGLRPMGPGKWQVREKELRGAEPGEPGAA